MKDSLKIKLSLFGILILVLSLLVFRLYFENSEYIRFEKYVLLSTSSGSLGLLFYWLWLQLRIHSKTKSIPGVMSMVLNSGVPKYGFFILALLLAFVLVVEPLYYLFGIDIFHSSLKIFLIDFGGFIR